MRPIATKQELRIKAAEALRAVLAEISAVKVREIGHNPLGAGAADGFRANVEIYGRPHTLACEVVPDAQAARVRGALDRLSNSIAGSDASATPVVIAPHLSAEAQAICTDNGAGFLDLDGNARLWAGEIFILKRTIPVAARRNVAEERPAHAAIHVAHPTAA